MTDKFAKSHPWRVRILRPFEEQIGALVVTGLTADQTREIAPPTTIPQSAGERMFKRKSDASEVVDRWRATHGADICGDPYRV